MAVWKVLLITLLAIACMGLASATFIVPLGYHGGERWAWLGGLLLATAVTGGLFALFLKHAGKSLNSFPRDSRL